MIFPRKHLQMIKDLISGMRIGESLYFQFDDLLLESDRLNALKPWLVRSFVGRVSSVFQDPVSCWVINELLKVDRQCS